MSKKSLYLFPFKLSATGDVIDGTMQHLCAYCRKQCNTKRCRDFYMQVYGKIGYYKCPYGFSVAVEDILGTIVMFTGLDIAGISDKKQVRRRVSKKDFVPRITKKVYTDMMAQMREGVASMKDYYLRMQSSLSAAEDYQSKIDTLDNTFHELRKLNGRLKAKVEWLIVRLDDPCLQTDSYLIKNIKDIFAASQLITIRLSTYDLILNPNSSLNYKKSDMPIYRKFDKVARLLDYQAQENGTTIKITGTSYSTYECNDMVELLPYLLLDNAIKYSMWNREIKLNFREIGNKLTVVVDSFSQRPVENELNSLLERGVRSRNVMEKIDGQGLGLYLARYICEANNINIDLSLGKKIETDKEGIKYSDFIVKLVFEGIVKTTS